MFLQVAYLENFIAPCFIRLFVEGLISRAVSYSTDFTFAARGSLCSSFSRMVDWPRSLRYYPSLRSYVCQNGHSYQPLGFGCDTGDFPPQVLVEMKDICYRYDFRASRLLRELGRPVRECCYLFHQLSSVAVHVLLQPCGSLGSHLPSQSLLQSQCSGSDPWADLASCQVKVGCP